jgi:hypothetical protein
MIPDPRGWHEGHPGVFALFQSFSNAACPMPEGDFAGPDDEARDNRASGVETN